MNIFKSLYELRPRRELNARVSQTPRHGALLRFEFAEGFGYADCHPWVEFGDAELAQQLSSLKAGELTPLLKRSLFFAQADARARTRRENIFDGLNVPDNHANLAASEVNKETLAKLTAQGFKTIKLKFGPLQMNLWSTIEYLMRIHPQLTWRLDFNASFNFKTAQAFLTSIAPEALAKIEFIEDACPFNIIEWTKLQTRTGRALAADFESDDLSGGAAYQIRVMKPAVQDPSEIPHAGLEGIVVTSYMDHPLGQSAAAWTAGTFANSELLRAGGLLSHTVYERTDFSEQLAWESPKWQPVAGTGFGFDDLLTTLAWTPL